VVYNLTSHGNKNNYVSVRDECTGLECFFVLSWVNCKFSVCFAAEPKIKKKEKALDEIMQSTSV
jgi:hypothetical protein